MSLSAEVRGTYLFSRRALGSRSFQRSPRGKARSGRRRTRVVRRGIRSLVGVSTRPTSSATPALSVSGQMSASPTASAKGAAAISPSNAEGRLSSGGATTAGSTVEGVAIASAARADKSRSPQIERFCLTPPRFRLTSTTKGRVCCLIVFPLDENRSDQRISVAVYFGRALTSIPEFCTRSNRKMPPASKPDVERFALELGRCTGRIAQNSSLNRHDEQPDTAPLRRCSQELQHAQPVTWTTFAPLHRSMIEATCLYVQRIV
jgi:hypothetical protein